MDLAFVDFFAPVSEDLFQGYQILQVVERNKETRARMKLHNTIIYLIGIPAVGKYTVAREIGRLTGAKVVDNQLINMPVFSVVGYDGTATFPFPQGAWAHIEKIRRAVFAVIHE